MSNSTSRVIDSVPPLKDNGFAGVMGASDEGFSLQSKLITQSGGAPFTVDLAAQGLKLMADANYVVIVQAEGKTTTVDESTKTSGSFDVLGGADADVLNVLVCGRLAGQKA